LTEAERAKAGIVELPSSLSSALDAFEADPIASRWLPDRLRNAFVALKRFEAARFLGENPAAVAATYREIY
jgi:glutamine synthetase